MELRVERALVSQLVSARAAIDACLALLDDEPEGPHAGLPCTHPEDKREDRSTMGHPRWRCLACGYLSDTEE